MGAQLAASGLFFVNSDAEKMRTTASVRLNENVVITPLQKLSEHDKMCKIAELNSIPTQTPFRHRQLRELRARACQRA